jgi:uncharacterized peroxidase-related enzyme
MSESTATPVLDQPTASSTQTSWLRVPDETTLPEAVREIFQQQQNELGLIHPYFQGFSLLPEHLLLWFNYYKELMYGKGQLSAKERELIAIVSSAANHCESCVTTHKAHLREVTGDPVLPDVLGQDYRKADLTQREHALADFAAKINANASALSPQDLEPLRQAGLSDEAILEAGEIAAQFSLSNRLSKAFGWKVGHEYDQLFR